MFFKVLILNLNECLISNFQKELEMSKLENDQLERFRRNIYATNQVQVLTRFSKIEQAELAQRFNSPETSVFKKKRILKKLLPDQKINYLHLENSGNFPNYHWPQNSIFLGFLKVQEELEVFDKILTIKGNNICLCVIKTRKTFFGKRVKYASAYICHPISRYSKISIHSSIAAYAVGSGNTLNIKLS